MNWLNTIFVLLAALLIVFWQAAFHGLRDMLGAQIDLLPALMVFAALATDLVTVSLLALAGGLWFDSLSANPLGVSVLPMFVAGLLIYGNRDLILRTQPFAQFVLGMCVSAAVPLLVLIELLTLGQMPVLGWGTLWQLAIMTVGGGLATPVLFVAFEWTQRSLVYGRLPETSFRPDREIRRGR